MLRPIFILLFFIPTAHSYYNDFSLKGSIGMNYQSINDERNTSSGLVGLSINTQFGYRREQFEVDLASYVTFGKADNVYFNVGDEFEVIADGSVRTFNFVPLLKYYTNWTPLPKRNFYVAAGPSWSLRTFWPTEYEVIEGELNDNYKITYRDMGIFGAFGLEEFSTFKEENPTFVEIMIGYSKSRKITVVDASDNQKVKIVHTDDVGPNIKSFVLMLNLGITLF